MVSPAESLLRHVWPSPDHAVRARGGTLTIGVALCLVVTATPPILSQSPQPPDTIWAEARATFTRAERQAVEVFRVGSRTGDPSFGDIQQITPTADGGVVVMDRTPDREPILVFGPDGRVLRRLGRYGDGPGEIRTGTTVAALSGGRIIAFDPTADRLTIWHPDGSVVTTSTRDHLDPLAIGAVFEGPEGSIFISEVLQERARGLSAAQWSLPPTRFRRVQFGADGKIAGITIPQTEFHLPPLLPRYPFAKSVYRIPLISGDIATVWSDRLGFAVPRGAGGGMQGYWVQAQPQALRPEEIEEQTTLRDVILSNGLKPFLPPRWEIPNAKPLVVGVRADRSGRLWLKRSTAGFRGPPVLAYKSSRVGELHLQFRDGVVFSGFDARGTYLGEVRFPDTISDVAFVGNAAWGVAVSAETGEQELVRFDLP